MESTYAETNVSGFLSVLNIFTVIFLAITVLGLILSIVRGREATLATSCRKAAGLAFFISLLLFFLRFAMYY